MTGPGAKRQSPRRRRGGDGRIRLQGRGGHARSLGVRKWVALSAPLESGWQLPHFHRPRGPRSTRRNPMGRRARVRGNHGIPSSRRTSSADRLAPLRYSARARSISAWNLGLRLSARDSRSASSMGKSAAIAWPASVKTSGSCSSSRAYCPSEFVAWLTSIVFVAHVPLRRSRSGSLF